MYAEIFLSHRHPGNQSTFTYQVPGHLQNSIKPGQIALVPFRQRQVKGLISKVHQHQPLYQTKDLIALESEPLLNEWQIALAKHMSQYYYCPLHKVLELFLPLQIWGQEKNLGREAWLQMNQPAELIKNELKTMRSGKQRELLEFMLTEKTIDYDNLIFQKKYSKKIIKTLLEKNLLKLNFGKIKTNLRNSLENISKSIDLNQETTEIFKKITASQTKISLLSIGYKDQTIGLYEKLANHYLSQKKQVLIIVPEISQVSPLLNNFYQNHRDHLAIIHSELPLSEKRAAWHRVKNKEANLIIGSRLGLFLPWQNLGLIIVHDEHDQNYKQNNQPRYQARDLAVNISQLADVPLILSSPAPSLASYYQATIKNYAFYYHKQPPSSVVSIVDLREELKKRNFTMISDQLEEKINEYLAKKDQIVLFLNRRGHSRSVVCRDCGLTLQCSNCQIPLTYHENLTANHTQTELRCHHCGYEKPMVAKCPRCQGVRIKHFRFGLEKLNQDIKAMFPLAQVGVLDAEFLKKGGPDSWQSIKNKRYDIIITTQIILQNQTLPAVGLLGIILADSGLNVPDFCASEKTIQLFTQLRHHLLKKDSGEMILQSYNPDHPGLIALKNHDFIPFFDQELTIRKKLNYPPFSKIIKLIFMHAIEAETKKAVNILETILKKAINASPNQPKISIFKNTPLYPQTPGKYQTNLIIKTTNPHELLNKINLPKGWKVDVEPISIIT